MLMLGHNDFHIIKAHKIELKQQKFPPKQFSWLEKFPTDKDIKNFGDILQQFAVDEGNQKLISFKKLVSIRKQLPQSVFTFLSPAIFFRAHSPEWPPSPSFRIPIGLIVDFVTQKALFTRNRIIMAKYDKNCNNTLTREQFSLYYRTEIMPQIEVLKNLEETFAITYLNTVESMFFFFLDAKHTGRIRVADAIVSGFLENAFALQPDSEDLENWFSPEKTHELNGQFQMYDINQKNYLDKEDFRRVQNGSFTSNFIERLFETHVSAYGEQMSYEEFIIFQIAYNHLAHPAALSYFFKILDVDEDGFITRYEMRYFYNELRLAYNGWFMETMMPEFDDFADQFFDMVKPVVNGRITLRELHSCKQGHDFVLCLISHTEFYRFEMRDSEDGGSLDGDSEMPSFATGEELGSDDEILPECR